MQRNPVCEALILNLKLKNNLTTLTITIYSVTRAQFHQRSTYSFYARISQKRKKTMMT